MKMVGLAGVAGLALLLTACGSKDDAAGETQAVPTAGESQTTDLAPGEAATGDAQPGSPAASETAAGAAPASATPASVPSPSAPVSSAPVSSAVAMAVPVGFNQCKVCHSVEKGDNGIGPSLAGIYKTKAGEVAGFDFSAAMKASGLVWDDKTLDSYLSNPRGVVPGTKMSFAGLKDDAKRKDVIAYLKTLK